ncbi:cytochrome c oxidase subunit I [Herpetosiphon llansteffanensis]|uniref:cytochrome c oxidase subunit I n=1 Tax=Herpetosiphon llansteffanensis TaxID=2094568 RepID=UPI000D7BC657|nr:cytochrome c oxidase subunit I [Herpetosiphon llansteffanensis]
MATDVSTLHHAPAKQRRGWLEWITTVDHKKIGIMYAVTAFLFFVIGGLEALLIRLQLGSSQNAILTPEAYNQVFTMHGTTMVFMAIMPVNAGFMNYFVPLMIGAGDMAYPRMNAMSYWLLLFGGIVMYSSFVFGGGAPDAGWFAYAPLTSTTYSVTRGMDYWVLGLQLLGVSSLAGSVNIIVTIIRLRAPGMRFNRMPLFVWMSFVTSFLLIFALPSITVGITLLFFDRNFGTNFFLPAAGGDPLLWQHLFWFFGHPEVYIMILPAFGVVSEMLPVFSRKPIFGYEFVAYSGVAIGVLGFTVWAHHMFATNLGVIADTFFAAASMLISVPTGVKIFNWLATLWRGELRFKTPMLFSLGFIAMFVIGGISGVSLAAAPFDLQVTDSYFVVAHFHYVLFGGAVFALFGAAYYWFPKITGKMMSERIGKWHFWILLLGFNLTFFPQHMLGLQGMPRRVWTYQQNQGWDFYNLLSTIGSFCIALATLVFIVNFIISLRKGAPAGNDPWDAATLEWATTSPPPAHNFDVEYIVHSRRPLWDNKYSGEGRGMTINYDFHPHLPPPSFAPIIFSFGLFVLAYGMLNLASAPLIGIPIILVALAIAFVGMNRWVGEIAQDPVL